MALPHGPGGLTVRWVLPSLAALGMAMAMSARAQVAPVEQVAQVEQAPLAAVQPPSAERAAFAQRPLEWTLTVVAPSPLDELLEGNLDLARFQREAGGAAEGGAVGGATQRISRGELRRLVAAVPEQARSLLDAEGYFSAEVRTRVSEPPGDGPVTVRIEVEPGPRTEVSRVQFVYEGELDTRMSAQDPEALRLTQTLSDTWALPVGEVFRQADWGAAKNEALARLRADTYPSASWSGTSVTVDAEQNTAQVFLVVDSGPAYAFGPVQVEGLARQPASAITNVSPFRVGDPYRERQLLDWQERIQKLNLFDNVLVSPALDPTQPGSTPIIVQVREAPMQSATAGIGVSSDNGPRLSLEHLHRNAFGLDWQAKTKVQLGARLSDAQLDLLSHPWSGRRRGLVTAQVNSIEDNDNARTNTQRLRVGRLREGERLERTDYVELQHTSVRSADDLLVANATALSATTQWIFRDVDSQVLPTRGTTSMAQLTLGRTVSALDSDGVFGRAHVRLTGYLPLPGAWHVTARAEAGQVIARDEVSVPDTLLFRAGGDDSVRGYAHRSLGVERDGVTVGGRSVATASVELSHPLSSRMPSLLGAVFVDVGDAAQSFDRWSAKRGQGLGIRWRSPVGPFRLDVAYGEATRLWRLHFSVGISL